MTGSPNSRFAIPYGNANAYIALWPRLCLCEPPEMFTFSGMFAEVMTFNGYRRLPAIDALRRLGVKIDGFGCPTEYEAALAPWAT